MKTQCVLLWMMTFGCGAAPRLVIGPTPSFPVFEKQAVVVPEPEPTRESPFDVQVRKAAARMPGPLRQTVLAVSVKDASKGLRTPSWTSLAYGLGAGRVRTQSSTRGPSTYDPVSKPVGIIDTLLPELLISDGYTKVIYPSSLRRILARVQHGETTKRGRDESQLIGPLDAMTELGGALPADYLLTIDIVGAKTLKEDIKINFRYPPEVLDAYEQEYTSYTAGLKTYRDTVRTLAGEYRQAYAHAQREYEAEGGEYEDEPSMRTRTEFEQWASVASRLEENLAKIAVPPSPQTLSNLAMGKVEQQAVDVGYVRLRARLVDLKSAETFWFTTVTAMERDVPQATRRALERLLFELRKETS